MVSIERSRPTSPPCHARVPRQACTCTSAKHHAVKMATLESSSSSVRLKTLTSSKSKAWKYFGFPGAVTNKKQVVCRFVYHLRANYPEEHCSSKESHREV